jgi:hypothetical protein
MKIPPKRGSLQGVDAPFRGDRFTPTRSVPSELVKGNRKLSRMKVSTAGEGLTEMISEMPRLAASPSSSGKGSGGRMKMQGTCGPRLRSGKMTKESESGMIGSE